MSQTAARTVAYVWLHVPGVVYAEAVGQGLQSRSGASMHACMPVHSCVWSD